MQKRTLNLNQIKLEKKNKTSRDAILKQKADKKNSLQLTKEEIVSSLTYLCVCHLESLSYKSSSNQPSYLHPICLDIALQSFLYFGGVVHLFRDLDHPGYEH